MSPLIVKIDGIRVWVYGRDHRPPHIHVEFGEDTAVIDIVRGGNPGWYPSDRSPEADT